MFTQMEQRFEGGCLCGAVRYVARGRPVRVSACHCAACQRRTGSAFGLGAYFRADAVEFSQGKLAAYEHRSDESHRWLRFEFCPACGTQVSWTVEALPGVRAIAVGTLDDPKGLPVERFGWMRSAHPWIVVPDGIEAFEKSALQPPK